jgi:hypothetical protein
MARRAQWGRWRRGIEPGGSWPVLTGASGAAATGRGGGLFPVQNIAVVLGILTRGESGSGRHHLGLTTVACSLALWSSMRMMLWWFSNQNEGQGSTRGLRQCFLFRRRSDLAFVAAHEGRWRQLGAPRGVTGMGFYGGSTPDVLCKDTCLILSPIAPRIIDPVWIWRGIKINLCSLWSNPDLVESGWVMAHAQAHGLGLHRPHGTDTWSETCAVGSGWRHALSSGAVTWKQGNSA